MEDIFMAVSDKIFRALEKAGFEHDPPEDTSTIYKGLVSGGEWTNVSLYCWKDDDNGRVDFGYFVDKSVDRTLRSNLRVELHNVAGVSKCSDAAESSDDAGFWVYSTLTIINDSIVDWVKSTMEELERRALFTINK
jgi:hypothetical protein